MSLCEDHFDDKCFVNASHDRLNKTAIPRHYSGEVISELYSVS